MNRLHLIVLVGGLTLACTDTTATEAGETGAGDERSLIVEPDFGPLCVGANVQTSFAEQLEWKRRIELAQTSLATPAPLPWPSPVDDWAPVDLELTTFGRDGQLDPGAAQRWAVFEGQGSTIFYAVQPNPEFDLLLLDVPLNDPGPGEDHVGLSIRVAARTAQDFVLGSSATELRELRTMNLTVADEQGLGKASFPVEACDAELPELPLVVEFERGRFEAAVALFPSHELVSGFLRGAQGELDGVEFALDDPFEQSVTFMDLFGETIHTIVRFAEPIGDACGLTFEWISVGASVEQPNIDWPTPIGHTIDCELAPIDELPLTFFSYN